MSDRDGSARRAMEQLQGDQHLSGPDRTDAVLTLHHAVNPEGDVRDSASRNIGVDDDMMRRFGKPAQS